MKRKENERLLDSIEYIDENIVNAVMAKIDPKAPIVNDKIRVRNRALRIAVSIAACLVLLAVAIPTVGVLMNNFGDEPAGSLIIENTEIIPQDIFADETSKELDTPPEHDGSRGLIYEINEDGTGVTWISFGSCTDEEVRIASHYDGLPVVEMNLKAYWEVVTKSDGIHISANEDYFVYGSKYVKSLIIPDTVEKLDLTVIEKCKNLESIYIGAGITHNLNWLLSSGEGHNINKIEVSPNNEKYMSINNCIIEKATKTLVRGCKTSIIPDDGSVEIIGAHAFSGVTDLKTIAIPDCIKVIERRAFASCYDLESIVLPAGLERIESGAFMTCQELVSIDLGGINIIPDNAFYSCRDLKKVIGIENVTEIGDYAFAFCRYLENITLGKGLTKIGEGVFVSSIYSIKYAGTMAEWNAVEKGLIWNGYSDGDYLSRIVCSDGTAYATAMSKEEYRNSKNIK